MAQVQSHPKCRAKSEKFWSITIRTDWLDHIDYLGKLTHVSEKVRRRMNMYDFTDIKLKIGKTNPNFRSQDNGGQEGCQGDFKEIHTFGSWSRN